MRRNLRTIGCILIYLILAVGMVVFLDWKQVCPQGERIWEYLYRSDFLYQAVKSGNGLLLYDPWSGNGTELLRFSEPLVVALLAIGQWIGGGNIGFAYTLFLGVLFFVSAAGIYWIGAGENRTFLGFLAGLAWFFFPVNLHLLLAEGDLAAGFVMAVFPFFFWNLYGFLEKGKRSGTVGAMLLFFLMVLSDMEYATVIFIATVVYLFVDGIVSSRIKRALALLPIFPVAYCLNGFWLCAFWRRYGNVPATSTEKAAYYQKILDTLNPLTIIQGMSDKWYLGISIFVLLVLGMLFSYKKSSSLFWSGMILVGMTTTVFSGAASNIQGLQKVDMTLLFPVIAGFAVAGFLLWNTLRKELVLVCSLLMLAEAGMAVWGYVPEFVSQTMSVKLENQSDEMLVKEACDVTKQRIAVIAGEYERALATYLVSKSEKNISVTQGVDYNATSITGHIGQLEQARADGNYEYLFDRCIELGDDTVLVGKSRLESGEKDISIVTKSAEKLGYRLKDENDHYLLYHLETEGTFGVVSEYDSIGIGSSAGMLALEYPDMEETSSTNLNDYTYEELSKYQSIYLNGFTYDDKEAAEDLLIRLSENGVKVVIEAGGIPADIVSKNREFLGVTSNDISFEKGFPILYTQTDEYDCNLFARGHENWKTVYIIGLDQELGYFYENQEKSDFMGTVKNDNLIFVGLNLGYHYALTRDPMVEEIYNGLLDLTDEKLPTRTLVPMEIRYEGDQLTIQTETAGNTTIAFHDNFYSEKTLKEKNELLYVEEGTTVLTIKPVLIGAGLFLMFAGVAIAVPYYSYIFRKQKVAE